jgi:CheY-like chemotaxis protein
MVVEDERIVAVALADQLRSQGYEIVANLGRAEQAIDRAVRAPPDLMLVDINLGGGIDGIEVVQRVCEHVRVPAVFMTAYADERTMERVARVTPIPCVRKPIDERTLFCHLRLALYVDGLLEETARLRAEIERLGGAAGSPPPLRSDVGTGS